MKIKKEAWCVLMMSHLIYEKRNILRWLKKKKFWSKPNSFMDTAGFSS